MASSLKWQKKKRLLYFCGVAFLTIWHLLHEKPVAWGKGFFLPLVWINDTFRPQPGGRRNNPEEPTKEAAPPSTDSLSLSAAPVSELLQGFTAAHRGGSVMIRNEVFSSFVFYAVLLIIKMYVVAIVTGQLRLRKKVSWVELLWQHL